MFLKLLCKHNYTNSIEWIPRDIQSEVFASNHGFGKVMHEQFKICVCKKCGYKKYISTGKRELFS